MRKKYMPIFLCIENKKFLIIGGGNVALQKTKGILRFSKNITILSPTLIDELKKLIEEESLNYIADIYKPEYIKDYDIIIVSINDTELQKEIYFTAKKENKLCNTVDVIEVSDFIFPSVVNKGDLYIAFSTSGISPSLARYLRILFEKIIPEEVEIFLVEMEQLRKTMPKGKDRQEFFEKKTKEFFEKYFSKYL